MGAKLRIPPKPEHYVRRDRLHRLLDQVVRAPISLVLAPAGAGKTSLLSGWADEHGAPTCWLTLDEADRDLVRFWTEILTALETVAPGCSDQTRRMLRHPDGIPAAVDQLLAGLEAHAATSAVLVLDDFHLVDEEESVVRSLRVLCRGFPRSSGWSIASRRVPKLPLDRLRARGHVGEVHFAELRLAPNEAAEMLTRLTPTMPGDQVGRGRPRRRMGGRPAALRPGGPFGRGPRATSAADRAALTCSSTTSSGTKCWLTRTASWFRPCRMCRSWSM